MHVSCAKDFYVLLTEVAEGLWGGLRVIFLCVYVCVSGLSPGPGGAHVGRRSEEEAAGALQQTRRRRLQPAREGPWPRPGRAALSLPVLLASSLPPHRSELHAAVRIEVWVLKCAALI